MTTWSIHYSDRNASPPCGKTLSIWSAARLLALALALTPFRTCLAGEQPLPKSNSLPPISTARQFLTLSAEEARRGYPVRLRGLVTYCDPEWRLLFLEDSTAPMFIRLPDTEWKGRAGDLAEVEGSSSAEGGIPVLVGVRPRTVGKGNLPQPADTLPAEVFSGEKVGSTVSLPCMVRSIKEIGGRLRMEMVCGGHRIRATVLEYAPTNTTELAGAKVQVKGVCSVNKETPEVVGRVQLFVPSMEGVLVLEPGYSDPFATPLGTTTNVMALALGATDARRMRLRASVAEQKLGESLVVRDALGTLRVATPLKTRVEAGDVVEVVGFPALDDQKRPVLADAVFRAVDRGTNSVARSVGNTSGAEAALPTLRTVAELRALSPDESRRGYPVEISGVVTFFDREWPGMFIHDGANGVYVSSGEQEFEVTVGDRVQVRGISDPGGYAPMITKPMVTFLNRGKLPEAKRAALEQLSSGRDDSQWVEVEGVVRSVRLNGNHLELDLAADGREFNALIPVPLNGREPAQLVDSKVRLRGVCGVRINANRQLVGILIHVPQWSEADVLEAGPTDPFAVAARPIRELLLFKAQDSPGRRVKVRGAVTLARPGGALFIQDETGGLALQAGSTNQARVGDQVEALGFPAPGAYNPVLERVRTRITGRQAPPPPIPTTANGLMLGTNDAELVSIKACLLERPTGVDRVELALRAEDVVFDAILDKVGAGGKLRDLQAGSLLELQGICEVKANAWREVRSFRILLRSSTDVKVLKSPPWWSLRRVLVLLGLAAGGALGTAGWAVLLRRRVGEQTKVIEEKLKREAALEQRYRDLVENAQDLIYTTDLESRFTSFNTAAERLTGYSLAEALDMKLAQLIAPADFDRMRARVAAHLAGEKLPPIEVVILGKHGSQRTLEISTSLLWQASQPVAVQGIGRDVTEQRNLEVQLRHAQKMESIGQLTAGIAHDYNNILTVVKGNLGFLEPAFKGSPDIREALEEISTATDRAANLTRQLLAFSRRQVIQPRVLDMNALVTNLARMLHRLLGETIVLHLDLQERLPAIEADPGMIEQVILNFAVNARDAMTNGGRLTISTIVLRVGEAHQRRNSEAHSGDHVCLTVTDTGSGMDATVLGHIFEPFFTTKAVGKGTGLGLATAFGIVKQHSGWIEVESHVGSGTTFKVFLPVCGRPVQAIQAATSLIPIQPGTGTVLVAEDEKALRIMSRRTLQRAGYRVFDAASGAEALRVWADHKEEIDLLFTDMVMPGGMSGRDLARKLLSEKPSLEVIYTSGYSLDLIGADSDWVRGARLLTKPFDPSNLVKAVKECLDPRV